MSFSTFQVISTFLNEVIVKNYFFIYFHIYVGISNSPGSKIFQNTFLDLLGHLYQILKHFLTLFFTNASKILQQKSLSMLTLFH